MDTVLWVEIAPGLTECTVYSAQASGPSPKSKKPQSKPVASSGGGSKKGGEAKKNGKQTGNGEVSEDDSASASSTPKKGAKDTSRKRKTEEASPALPAANQENPVCVKRAKTARDNNRDLGLCRYVASSLLILVFLLISPFIHHLLQNSPTAAAIDCRIASVDKILPGQLVSVRS